jgi:ubiquitin-like 1-activating enzyme E1 A
MAHQTNGAGEANPATNGITNGSALPPLANSQPVINEPSQMTQATAFAEYNIPDVPNQLYQASDEALNGEAQTISADEIALYDRQIRLWGVKAQERLRSAKILLIGMTALANEIAKNLVLAGVGSLTILDHGLVTEDDLSSQFFIAQEHVGQNRAQAALPQILKLNPRVALFADPDPVASKYPEYFSSFDITIATRLDIDTLTNINAACRFNGRKFYAADTHGMYGYVFADLILHEFVVERQMGNKATEVGKAETPTRIILSTSSKRENGKSIEMVRKSESFSPLLLANTSPLPADISNNRRRRLQVTPLLSCFRALFDFQKFSMGRLPSHSRADLELFTRLATEKHRELLLPPETLRSDFLRSFLQNLGSEISPVAAFLGGSLAQDVINVLGQREQPLQNMLLFDGEEFKSPIYSMHPYVDDTLPFAGAVNITNGVSTNPAMTNFANGMTSATSQMA